MRFSQNSRLSFALFGACVMVMTTLTAGAPPVAAGTISDRIAARGELRCGVQANKLGFSGVDNLGTWRGFSVDLCRALAIAIFGRAEGVRFVPLTFQQMFVAVQSGEIDLSADTITHTLSRDMNLSFSLPVTYMLSGHTFMVPRSSGLKEPKDLGAGSICILQGSSAEGTVADFFRSRGLSYEAVPFSDAALQFQAYEAGRCDAVVSEPSVLAGRRAAMRLPDDQAIMEQLLSKEPFSMLIAQGDDDFADMIRLVIWGILQAEELGISQQTVERLRSSSADVNVRRFLGSEDDIYSKRFGWPRDRMAQVVSAVGNYAEVWDRNLGQASTLKLDRGINRLWRDGGILFAPAWR